MEVKYYILNPEVDKKGSKLGKTYSRCGLGITAQPNAVIARKKCIGQASGVGEFYWLTCNQ